MLIRRLVTMAESIDVKAGITSVLERIDIASKNRSEQFKKPVQLVAVSKTKPVEAIIEAYSIGQRHFGENYVQELVEKANDAKILEHCKEIKWHLIGHLQTNKINKITKLPGLHMVQTVDSEKLATSLNTSWEKYRADETKLKVLLQVNTSNEEAKSGIEPSKTVELYNFIKDKCDFLEVDGLMTIGAYGFDYSVTPINPDFVSLMKCLNSFPNPDALNVSFGMSDDFERAIVMGSTIVRVGSSVFGHRTKKIE